MKFISFLVSSILLLSLGICEITAQTPVPTPSPTPPIVGEVSIATSKANTDAGYVALRKGSDFQGAFTGDFATVNNLVLKRDAATFTLRTGELYFLSPSMGKTVGAVFFGDGEMNLIPPVDSEKKMLNFFTESTELTEQFSKLVVFFTDETFDEVKKSPKVKWSANGSQAFRARDAFREKEDLLKNTFRYNITTRLLMDVYSTPRAGFFTCFIDGKRYNKLLYKVDPTGIPEVAPEQVALINYDNDSGGIWAAFHLQEEYKNGTAKSSVDRRVFDLLNHNIDITLRGTRLIATDKVTVKTLISGQRVLPFALYPTLRVKRIFDSSGQDLDIIQESAGKDGSLAVILPTAPEIGKSFDLTFEYEGEGVLQALGTGNFILTARSTWYPNNGATQFAIDRATFAISFRYPKNMTMIGVGEQIGSDKIEGDLKVSMWSSKDIEMKVAGFNYGDFIKREVKDSTTGYNLEVFVNKEVPDEIKSIQNRLDLIQSRSEGAGEARRNDINNPDGAIERQIRQRPTTTLGSISTTSMADYVLMETQNATRIYDGYFGKMPFSRLAMSQQPNTFFGQAWGSLIYMPYLAFVGTSQRAQLLGQNGGTDGFWREVAAHEVAHQWWGHSVGWYGYHDQWMSEGFSQLSTSLYIQFVKKDLKSFNEFWEEQRLQIVSPSRATNGIKPYTVGPVTQGYRLNTPKTGRIAQNLIYPKGAYILHMIRMMMTDRKHGETKFQSMMRDFVKTHYNKEASTEDFKAIVEKHIIPKMDLDKNGKMDWFFDQWVYGTEVPAYKLEYSLNSVEGKSVLSGKITQSGVSDSFAMVLPLYLDFGNGWVSAGSVTIVGNKSFDLGNITLPQTPKKVAICALSDVLATSIENVKK